MAQRKHIIRVLNRTTLLEGDQRIARYQVLAGGRTVAVHREFGFSDIIDAREVFFKPPASERRGVALQATWRRA